MLPWMATGAVPVWIRTATHFSSENSHRETSHRGRTFRSPWAFVGFTATLRYEPCPQFINVSQKTLHIYWQFSAMSHAIHKIVSIKRCQSYFISRRSPHLGISKDSELCASAHRCLHYAYARLIARVTFNLFIILLLFRMEICEGGAVRQFPEHPGVDPNEKRNGYRG